MDFKNKDSLLQNNVVETKDRISELPTSLLHCILSFLETEAAAQTSVLSKRWNQIWRSIPTLQFVFYDESETPSLSRTNKFEDFVDTTLRLHDPTSNIQKFSLFSETKMNASRVHSWMEILARHNVEELILYLEQDEHFTIPISRFTCSAFTELELCVGPIIHFPKNIAFLKLKSLRLVRVRFNDSCWNEKLFSNCPVLEELSLEGCTWFGMRKVCISSHTLKVLEIENRLSDAEDGLRDCDDLKIHAPSLVDLKYWGIVGMDYDLSRFLALDSADVRFSESRSEPRIGRTGAAVSKFLRAISHVRCLVIHVEHAEVLSTVEDFVNNLPTFHNLNVLSLRRAAATDKLIFALLKAAPNLRELEFGMFTLMSTIDDEKKYDETEELFRHLQSVRLRLFSVEGRDFRWAKLILKNAKSLQIMTIADFKLNAKSQQEAVMSGLSSLPRASKSCQFKYVDSV